MPQFPRAYLSRNFRPPPHGFAEAAENRAQPGDGSASARKKKDAAHRVLLPFVRRDYLSERN